MSSYEPPIPPQNQVVLDSTQVAKVLDSVRTANDYFRNVNEGIEALLEGHQQDLEKQRAFMNQPGERGIQNIVGDNRELVRERSEQAQRDVYYNMRQRQATADAEKMANQFETLSVPERVSLLHQAGVIRGQGGAAMIGEQYLTDITGAMQRQIDDPQNIQDKDINILARFNEDLSSEVQRVLAEKAPGKISRVLDTLEESGIQQLQYGQLTFQDIIRAAGTSMGRYYAARQRNILDAQIRVEQARSIGQEPALSDLRRIGVERGGVPGRFGGLGTRAGAGLEGFLGLGARFLPVAGQAVAVGGVVANIAQNQVIGRVQNAQRMGQITGDNWRTGFGAQFQAYRMGINPFDMISREVAQQIVTGVRQEGFRGEMASALNESIKDTIEDLGISPDSALALFSTAVRKTGETVATARERFEHFDEAARNLNMSVEQYTQNYIALQNQFLTSGAGRQAPNLSAATIAATPEGFRDNSLWPQLQQRMSGAVAASIGVPISMIGSERFAPAAAAQTEALTRQLVNQAAQVLGTDDANAIANYLSNSGNPYFQGMPIDNLAATIRRMRSGRGPSTQLGIQKAITSYGQGIVKLRSQHSSQMSRADLRFKSSEWLRQAGLTEDEIRDIKSAAARNERSEDRDTMYTVQGANKDVPLTDRISLNRRIYEQVQGDLTGEQRKYFMEHIADPSFDVQGELRKMAGAEGPNVGPSVTQGGIQIRLKPGMETKLFELAKERNDAIARGDVTPNAVR